jgi:hypothetical protein
MMFVTRHDLFKEVARLTPISTDSVSKGRRKRRREFLDIP